MAKIAIDGPAGAGKSTIAKAVAKELGWIYVDTGAMYRAIGLAALREGIVIKEQISEIEAMLPEIELRLRYENSVQRILLNGEDVSEAIRTPEASVAASDVSAIPAVRAAMLTQQRNIAEQENVVMDGRDIGTVVLPDAELKVFLTASAHARAKRRCKELMEKGQQVVFADVLKDIEYRDKQDSGRAVAPLQQAEDAILVDTTHLTLEQSIESVMNLVRTKL
ncbi:MAG: (d)CMP kinase [Ruminococcaceae bacterium]|nr:(d)CMP kinase [Oscillospiraceae bacterium]